MKSNKQTFARKLKDSERMAQEFNLKRAKHQFLEAHHQETRGRDVGGARGLVGQQSGRN